LLRSAGRTEVHLEGDGAADPDRTSRSVLRRGVCNHRSRILQWSVSRRLPQQRHRLHGVYNGTIRLQIDFDSTAVRLLIKGH